MKCVILFFSVLASQSAFSATREEIIAHYDKIIAESGLPPVRPCRTLLAGQAEAREILVRPYNDQGLALPTEMPEPFEIFFANYNNGEEISGPQFWIPFDKLERDERAQVNRLLKASLSPNNLKIAKTKANGGRSLKSGIEVGKWRVTLKNGKQVWSRLFTSHLPDGIFAGHSDPALTELVQTLRARDIVKVDWFHTHPMGAPLSEFDIGFATRGKGGLPMLGSKRNIPFSMNAIVQYSNGVKGLYRHVNE